MQRVGAAQQHKACPATQGQQQQQQHLTARVPPPPPCVHAGARERGCLPAGVTARLLLAGALLGSLGCCAYWLHLHAAMRREFGGELGAR